MHRSLCLCTSLVWHRYCVHKASCGPPVNFPKMHGRRTCTRTWLYPTLTKLLWSRVSLDHSSGLAIVILTMASLTFKMNACGIHAPRSTKTFSSNKCIAQPLHSHSRRHSQHSHQSAMCVSRKLRVVVRAENAGRSPLEQRCVADNSSQQSKLGLLHRVVCEHTAHIILLLLKFRISLHDARTLPFSS